MNARLVLLAGLVLGACSSLPDPYVQPVPEPVLRSREQHAANGNLVRRWSEIVRHDGPPIAHGRDEAWFTDGQPRYDRSFDQGEPTGHWRSWYASGGLRSDYAFSGEGLPTEQRFFHENGETSAVGPARDGIREGVWEFFFDTGRIRKRVTYRGGEPHGPCTLWHPQGGLRSRGNYANGERVGEWEHWPIVVAEDMVAE